MSATHFHRAHGPLFTLRRWAGAIAIAAAGGCGNAPIKVVDDVAPDASTVPNPVASGTSSMVDGVARIPLFGCSGFEYFLQTAIGGQTVNLLVDSGSTTLAVAGAACTTCKTDHTYRPGAQARSLGRSASARYLDNSSWNGGIYRDAVAVGPQVTPAVPLDFAVITAQSNFFQAEVSCSANDDTFFDGIIGLGPDDLLLKYTTSFLTTLAASNTVKEDAFAVQHCDVGGTMWVGGYDSNAMSAAPKYTPMVPSSSAANTSGAYEVNVSAMGLGSQTFALNAADIGPMVFDNGTNIILLTTNAYNAFVQAIGQSSVYVNNFGTGFIEGHNGCLEAAQGMSRAQLDAQLPPFVLSFPDADGSSFTVSLPATSSYLLATSGTTANSNKVIYCPLVAESDGLTLIGHVAMRSLVTIFDRGNQQIGMAPQVGCQPKTVILTPAT